MRMRRCAVPAASASPKPGLFLDAINPNTAHVLVAAVHMSKSGSTHLELQLHHVTALSKLPNGKTSVLISIVGGINSLAIRCDTGDSPRKNEKMDKPVLSEDSRPRG